MVTEYVFIMRTLTKNDISREIANGFLVKKSNLFIFEVIIELKCNFVKCHGSANRYSEKLAKNSVFLD